MSNAMNETVYVVRAKYLTKGQYATEREAKQVAERLNEVSRKIKGKAAWRVVPMTLAAYFDIA